MAEKDKSYNKEEEYFLRLELERRRKNAEEHVARMADETRRALKEMHWMRCPKCGRELLEIEYRGHKVDQCSSCRGLWLDAGELESLARPEESGFLGSLKKMFEG
ncbi:MAG: zf-TFIIB domain-containing protein [Geothrix sp.]|nr:zf-TFIIB domain-containing protein [Geothrix sp.]